MTADEQALGSHYYVTSSHTFTISFSDIDFQRKLITVRDSYEVKRIM